MLINKPLQAGDTVTIKFNSGEEIIARLEEAPGTDKVKISKPVSLVSSGEGVGFAPWLFSADPEASTLSVNMAGVLVLAPTASQAASAYIKQTTGLETGIHQ